jgi:polysaccharide export outer membrane protein
MKLVKQILVYLCLLSLVGCDALPGLSPTPGQLMRTHDDSFGVYLVKVTSAVTKALASYQGPALPAAFRMHAYNPSVALRPGDAVNVTVFESPGSGGTQGVVPPLMVGASSTLPMQVVEPDGAITVPYVGRVKVGNNTPSQAAKIIQEALGAQAVRPQVVVSLAGNTANTVSVGGEVNKAGLMPLTLRGERLLDAVAWAGGPKFPAIQIDLRLMRRRQVISVPLQQIMSNPEDNVVAEPNDNIVLVNNPKTFIVMGATQKVNQYPFDVENVTLAEALARAGGGLDAVTNLRAIYLFRYESERLGRTVLAADKQAVDAHLVDTRTPPFGGEDNVPVVYRVDLTQADGYFFAQQIRLRDKDLVLLATSEVTQFLKLMQVVRAITGSYYDLKRVSND